MDPGFDEIQLNWSDFSTITLGRFMKSPQLDTIHENQFIAVRLALSKAYEYGYKRPGLIVVDRINLRTLDQLRSSFDSFMLLRSPSERIPSLIVKSESDISELENWISENRIDVVISHSHFIHKLNKRKSPESTLPYISINLQKTQPDPELAGAMYNDLEIARLAVTILNDNILTGSLGIPETPKSLLIENNWRDGPSLPRLQ